MRVTETSSDAELIEAFSSGDERGFELLYDRYRRQLYGFLQNLIGNHSVADEIFEESWLRVIDKLPNYRDDGRFSAWLFRLARNLFFDRTRREKKHEQSLRLDADDVPEVPGQGSMEADAVLEADELGKVIGEALAELPPEQREVFLLRQQELSFKEIAKLQNCPVNTVLGRMQYALKSLRKIIRRIDGGSIWK